MSADLEHHEPCGACVRCATCRREWCPTILHRCPGEESSWVHVTGGLGTRDDEYCYKCTRCPGGYFQFHHPDHPHCTEIPQGSHQILDGRGEN